MKNDSYWMLEALFEARRAAELGEIPVGAVIIRDGSLIARGYNQRERHYHPIGHAELIALARAGRAVKDWRLTDCTIYVTLEPCPMCTEALATSRVQRVVYGLSQPLRNPSGYSIVGTDSVNQLIETDKRSMNEECFEITDSFFRELRRKNRF